MTNDNRWFPALAGGVAGSLLTAALIFAAVPRLAGDRIVREALTAHPELLVEAGDALRDKQYAPTLAAWRQRIETPFHSSWKGAAKPDVTMAYFYDYACTYCRKSNPDIERLLAEDKGLRIVYRELPILGPDSLAAARVSLEASKAGKFAAFHDALYAASPHPTGPDLATAARSIGLAPVPGAADVENELKQNFDFVNQIGATGTPLFIIGDKVINAAVGYDALKKAVDAARKG